MSEKLPYAIWTVDGRDYKLKLTTSAIIELEKRLGVSLMSVLNTDSVPALTVMLLVTHKAMQKFEHGVKENDLYDLYDTYIEEGGDQISFMTNVFMPIFRVSGFFPKKTSEEMGKQLELVQNELK